MRVCGRAVTLGLLAFVSLFLFVVPASATITLYGTFFEKPRDAGYNEDWAVDDGGTLMVLVRNTGTTNERVNAVKIDGSSVSGNSKVKWWRSYPTTLTPGEEGCIWVKSTDSSFLDEGKAISVEATTAAGSTATRNYTCGTSELRIGSVVPSQDRRTLYIFVRNTSTSVTYTSIDQVYVNDNVLGQSTILGGNMASKGVAVIKVAYTDPLPLRKHLNVQVRAQKTGGGTTWAQGVTRLVEGWFPIGTWSSSLYEEEDGLTYARNLLIDLAVTNDSNRVSPRYHIKIIKSSTDPAYIQGQSTNTNIGTWMVDDEPDLHSEPSSDMNTRNKTYWDNDPNHYTWLNLCTSHAFNEYGHIADIVGEDHYAMFSAPNVIPTTWSLRTADMEEALDYAQALKDNTEPKRMWVWSQLAAPGTWGTQPRDYGVDYQFWANIGAGAKGILWFKYGPGYEDDGDTDDLITKALSCAKRFNQVRSLLLYGDVSTDVDESDSDVMGRAIIGENAVVVIILNNTIHTTGMFPWDPGYSLDTVSGNVKVDIPSFIPIEDVYKVGDGGRMTASYSVSGRQVTINYTELREETFVYVIGRNDAAAPDAPEGLNCARIKGGNVYTVSWKDAFDDYGIQSYRVYVNGAWTYTTQAPICDVTLSNPFTDVVTVKARDSKGNLSAASLPFTIGKWHFGWDGYAENWRATNANIANYGTANGVLSYDVVGGNDPEIESPTLSLNANTFRYLHLRLRNQTADNSARIRWITSTSTTYGSDKALAVYINPNSEYTDYYVDMKSDPEWAGTITQFRVGAPDLAPGHVDIDTIEFVSSIPDTTPPDIPGVPWTGINYTNQTSITWYWNPVSDNPGGSGIQGYHLVVNDTLGNNVFNAFIGNLTSYTVGGLLSGRTYAAYVHAVDNANNYSGLSGWGGYTGVDTQAPTLSGPANPSAAYSNNGQIAFNWIPAVDTGGSGIQQYYLHIWRTDIAWGQPGSDVGPGLIGNTTGYTFAGGQDGVTYMAWVYAIDNANNWGAYNWGGTCMVDTQNPVSGTATCAASAATGPLAVDYSGASDSGSGLQGVYLWYKKDAGAWEYSGLWNPNASGSFSFAPVSGDGRYYFALDSNDNAGNSPANPSGDGDCSCLFDATAPTAPTGLQATAVSISSVDLAWNASTDTIGVTGYKIYRNGVEAGVSMTTSYSDGGLAQGVDYTYTVTAYDGLGNESDASNTVQATTLEIKIGEAKKLGDGQSIELANKAVTAVFGNTFYIEDMDRSAGIMVVWNGGTVSEGAKVRVTGIMGTTFEKERFINASGVDVVGSASLEALLLPNRSLGGLDWYYDSLSGAGQTGVEDGTGLNNIGLLVRTTGQVKALDNDFFYMDDGTNATDFSVFAGIRVVSGSLMEPQVGAQVSVSGISSILNVDGRIFRCIRPRYQADID